MWASMDLGCLGCLVAGQRHTDPLLIESAARTDVLGGDCDRQDRIIGPAA
jgi:hypothetical protein